MSKPSRRPGREARKAKNPWDRDPGVNPDDPHAVLAACQQRLARAHAAGQNIKRSDDALKHRAMAEHDHHVAEAGRLAEEIRHLGVGEDPLLEDAHAHHLAERTKREQVLAALRHRAGAY